MPLVPHYVHPQGLCVSRNTSPTSEPRAEIHRESSRSYGRRANRRTKRSTFKGFSMMTGAPTSTSAWYRVSRDHVLLRVHLTEKRRGRGWKPWFRSEIKILWKNCCLSLPNCIAASQKRSHRRGHYARRWMSPKFVGEIFPTDERIDREDYGDQYIRGYIFRGRFSRMKSCKTLTPYS